MIKKVKINSLRKQPSKIRVQNYYLSEQVASFILYMSKCLLLGSLSSWWDSRNDELLRGAPFYFLIREWEFNSTPHQSPRGFPARFAAKTKALARELCHQMKNKFSSGFFLAKEVNCHYLENEYSDLDYLQKFSDDFNFGQK